MTSADSLTCTNLDGYRLGRDYTESVRLNLQHYLWKDALGYNIHSDIEVENSKEFRIADIGTGTGIWLIDVSRELSSATLDGFDISSEQYPSEPWMPSNISLRELDILAPVPVDLLEKYDVINIRFLLVVVRDDDPGPILQNIIKMLKPGGYIQWSELDVKAMNVASTATGTHHPAMEQLLGGIQQRVQSSWVPRLPSIFAEHGLISTSSHHYPVRPEMRLFFTHVNFMTSESTSFVTMDNSRSDSSGPKYRQMIRDASTEAKAGACLAYTPEVAIGRKPL